MVLKAAAIFFYFTENKLPYFHMHFFFDSYTLWYYCVFPTIANNNNSTYILCTATRDSSYPLLQELA